jgi:hypothetical protein
MAWFACVDELMAPYYMGDRKEKSLETALNYFRIKALSFLSTNLRQVL